jgi:Protein of unknown function (DUF4238)
VADAFHHYVPQFHLRQFGHSDGNGRIWVYDKTTDEIFRRSVKSIAGEPGYYTVTDPQRGTHDDLERLFSMLESSVAPLIKQLATLPPGRHPVSFFARDALAGYIALLYHRGPRARAWIHGMGQLIELAHLDMDLRDPERFRRRARAAGMTGTDQELEHERQRTLADIESGTLTFEAPREWGLFGLSIAVEGVRPLLKEMCWRVLHRRAGLPFIAIGDTPVVLGRPDDLPAFLGVGFGTPGVEVYVPLSYGSALVLTHEPHDAQVEVLDVDSLPNQTSLTPVWTSVVNAQTFLAADRYVFGHSQADLEFTRFSLPRELRMRRPKAAVSGLPDEWRRYLTDAFEQGDATPGEPAA